MLHASPLIVLPVSRSFIDSNLKTDLDGKEHALTARCRLLPKNKDKPLFRLGPELIPYLFALL